jgi:hypothetical protein
VFPLKFGNPVAQYDQRIAADWHAPGAEGLRGFCPHSTRVLLDKAFLDVDVL